MRLYYVIVLSAAATVFVLHGAIGLLSGFGDKQGPVLIGMDAVLLLLGVLGRELTVHAQSSRQRKPRGWLLIFVGLYLVVLISETGGLASPFSMLLLLSCVFASLTMSGLGAMLLTALLGAMHAAGAWLLPNGLLKAGLAGIHTVVLSGRHMELDEATGIAMRTVFLFLGAYLAHRLSAGFRSKVDLLQVDAMRDPLTGLPNRRGFLEKMRGEIARAERYAWPISILMLDLDHFKRVNDAHGHGFGDLVLKEAAQILRDTVGPVDHLARVGGEEFAVAAVAADTTHGSDLAGRIVRRFRQHPWGAMKPGLKVTCSIGVAGLDTRRNATSPDASLSLLLEKADGALYQVKESGRNNHRLAQDEDERPQQRPRTPLPRAS